MYKRVLLKLSGESLGGAVGKGLDPDSLRKYSKEIAQAAKAGLQIAIVNGGGNIFRGLQGLDKGFDRVEGDRMGMLATVINSLALSQFITITVTTPSRCWRKGEWRSSPEEPAARSSRLIPERRSEPLRSRPTSC